MTRWLVPPLLAVALASAAVADPLRAIPKAAALVLHVEKPRKLVEAFANYDRAGKYPALPQVRALLQSEPARRAFQLLAHIEKALGAKWPDLLDNLGGNGIALGTFPGTDPAPTVVALEGTDAAAVAGGFELAIRLIEAELTRQSGSDTPVSLPRGSHAGATTVSLGEARLARAGTFVLLATSETLLHAAIDRLAAKGDPDSVTTVVEFQRAKKLLAPKPLATLWLNLLPVKETQASKDFFAATRKDFLQTMVVGSTVDAVRRSDFVAIGLYETATGMKLSVRMPAKRDGLPKDFGLHVPMGGDHPGTLPLLEPPGVLFSESVHLDLAAMWRDRATLFNDQVLKDIEKGAKDISKLLPNTSLDTIFAQSGPHHRFVAVERGHDQYAVKPGSPLPEMAIVSSMRDKEFATGMSTALRGGGFIASLQFGLKMTEEVVNGVKITSYRFPEKGPYAGDDDGYRFNFVPCFAATHDSFLIATSPRLLKDLLVELKKPTSSADTSAAVWRGKGYGRGAATAFRGRPDPIITDAILSRGVGLKEARAEVAQLAAFLDTVGDIGFTMDHAPDAFKFDVEWKRK